MQTSGPVLFDVQFYEKSGGSFGFLIYFYPYKACGEILSKNCIDVVICPVTEAYNLRLFIREPVPYNNPNLRKKS